MFLPTDVGLTAKELTDALKDYDHSNGVVFIYYPDVPRECVTLGRQAAAAAGFTRITARLARNSDEGQGSVPL